MPLVADPLKVCRATNMVPDVRSHVPTSVPLLDPDEPPPLELVKLPLALVVAPLLPATATVPFQVPLNISDVMVPLTVPEPVGQLNDPPALPLPLTPTDRSQAMVFTVHVPLQFNSSAIVHVIGPLLVPEYVPRNTLPLSPSEPVILQETATNNIANIHVAMANRRISIGGMKGYPAWTSRATDSRPRR